MNVRRRFCAAGLAAVMMLMGGLTVSAQEEGCIPDVWTLWAGQTKDVGTLTVSNDETNLYVTYTLDYQDPSCPDGAVDATFGTLHLWVGDDLLDLPSNGPGNPQIGHFPYSFNASGLKAYTFTIPFSELAIKGVTTACGTKLYVVAHAEVNYLNCDGTPSGDGDTAFGGDIPGGTGARWWFYGEYTVCCEDGPPPVPFCQTAYAKGGYVWTTDRKSNPENLPSLNLTRNRWGWAINIKQKGTTTCDIWAGAGLNKTSNGVKVGTLTVTWNDDNEVCFTYSLTGGYTMQELHVYAGDTSPTTIAPGQYGYIEDFNDAPVGFYEGCVEDVADTNGDGVWVVAHAVVCMED